MNNMRKMALSVNWHAPCNADGIRDGMIRRTHKGVMTMFRKIELQRLTVSLLGALVLSAACVTAAVAPVKAASIATTRY